MQDFLRSLDFSHKFVSNTNPTVFVPELNQTPSLFEGSIIIIMFVGMMVTCPHLSLGSW